MSQNTSRGFTNSKTDNFIRILLVTALIYLSGSIYFVSFYYSQACIALFAVTAILFLFGKAPKKLNSHCLLFFLMLLVSLCIMLIVSGTSKFTSYIAIILQLLIALIFVHLYDWDCFRVSYLRIMMFFATVSLFCYFLMVLDPSIMLLFPMDAGDGALNYHNAIIHVFSESKGYSYFVPFLRNNGIFWEPGAYQAFLNLAILFFFQRLETEKPKRYELVGLPMLILATITTYSTTGYIVLAVIVMFNLPKINKLLSGNKALTMMLAILFLFLLLFFNDNTGLGFSYFADKLNAEFGDNNSFTSRIDLNDLDILFADPLNILGISFEAFAENYGGAANSIIHTAVCIGLPFTLLLLGGYVSFSLHASTKNRLLPLIALILIFSSESLIWRPIFLILCFYGVSSWGINTNKLLGYRL